MTTLLTRAHADAPPIRLPGAEADTDRVVRLTTGVALWLSVLLITYWDWLTLGILKMTGMYAGLY